MLAIEININVLLLAVLFVAAFSLGYLLRSAQLRSNRKKILELEREMLSNHAQILDLEKEKAGLLQQMKESKIPVISINPAKDDNDKNGNRKFR